MKPDTKTHLLGGLIVLAFTLIAFMVAWLLHMHPLTTVMAISGIVAGACVEGTQANDNKLADRAGLPRPHEVSWRDLAHSAIPCLVAAVLVEAVARQHWGIPILG